VRAEYFELDRPSPYMLLVAQVRRDRCVGIDGGRKPLSVRERIHQVRSDIPAITHVDYSARVQTVNRETSPRYYDLIKAFDALTGCGVIINTSFNVRGEPIVCTPEDAYRCFMRTEMDYLVLDDFLLDKKTQPPFLDRANWRKDFVLD
jgi:carbamoyltransferase